MLGQGVLVFLEDTNGILNLNKSGMNGTADGSLQHCLQLLAESAEPELLTAQVVALCELRSGLPVMRESVSRGFSPCQVVPLSRAPSSLMPTWIPPTLFAELRVGSSS